MLWQKRTNTYASMNHLGDETLFWALESLASSEDLGILRPIQKRAPMVTFSAYGVTGLSRLVADFHAAVGIDFRRERIHRSKGEEGGGFDDALPLERVNDLGIGRHAQGIGAVIGAGLERADGAAMFVVAHAPHIRTTPTNEGMAATLVCAGCGNER